MPRMIDPSDLEGDELDRWYRRSPADVEAEREAARQRRYDAFFGGVRAQSSEGDDLESESDPEDVETISDRPRFIQARFPMSTPVMPAPSGPMVGPQMDTQGTAPLSPARSGFFNRYDFSPLFGGYLTDRPNPLNYVEGTPGGRWILGDSSPASSDEVERIYAEQQRRLRGEDDTAPAAHVHDVDNLKDGSIPRADQVAKGERELDPTCSPYGGWERDPGFPRYSQRTQDYETQVTRAPGLDYVVRAPGQPAVKFDGCAVWDPRHPLLEAKGPGYASLLPKAMEWGFYGNMLRGAVDQAGRQKSAAPNQRVEWHIAEPGAYRFFDDATFGDQPPIVVKQTPVR